MILILGSLDGVFMRTHTKRFAIGAVAMLVLIGGGLLVAPQANAAASYHTSQRWCSVVVPGGPASAKQFAVTYSGVNHSGGSLPVYESAQVHWRQLSVKNMEYQYVNFAHTYTHGFTAFKNSRVKVIWYEHGGLVAGGPGSIHCD
jgi:hypothetical protein